ncbi:hypothetical protein Avbf_08441, partial [Armadillidium vulgare]
ECPSFKGKIFSSRVYNISPAFSLPVATFKDPHHSIECRFRNWSRDSVGISLSLLSNPSPDEIVLSSIGIGENARIHLMVKKGESKPSSTNFYVQLDTLLRNHLSHEQTLKVIGEFKKNCQVMIDSMNFDDIERFAASNFTQF